MSAMSVVFSGLQGYLPAATAEIEKWRVAL
jgi:hypothetical protein